MESLNEIIATKPRVCTLCTKVNDTGREVLIKHCVFSNSKKVYEYLNTLGTIYARRSGNAFSRPLMNFSTFNHHYKKEYRLTVHVAKTGSFAGRYIIEKMVIQ